jgi:hypothetical protein
MIGANGLEEEDSEDGIGQPVSGVSSDDDEEFDEVFDSDLNILVSSFGNLKKDSKKDLKQ